MKDVRSIPFRPSDIPYTLQRIERDGKPEGTVRDPEARFRQHPRGQEWLDDHYGEFKTSWHWNKDYHSWRNVPADVMLEIFTFEECLRIWFGSVIMSELGKHIEERHFLLWKIQNSHWRYGFHAKDWNLMVEHLEGLKKLSIDLLDFEVRLTHSTAFNETGWSEHDIDGKRIYIDGTFGLLLYYKGKHVLTVGFSLAENGILIAQAQLREKRGNRFLYHLPKHYLDIAIEILGRAFGNDTLCLVTGESTAQAIRQAYLDGSEAPDSETVKRIQSIYDRPLEGFRRGRKVGQWYSREFVRLYPRRRIMKAA